MNLQKIQTKIFKKKIQNIKHLFHRLSNKEIKKFNPNLSCRNSFQKSRQNKFFTIDQTNIDKLKIKNSSSSLFQSNDVDLVRSLNFDHIEQINDDSILRYNLMNSLQKYPKEEEEDKTKDLFQEKFQNNESGYMQLPKLEKLKSVNRYKSYELIHDHKRKIQNEKTEQYQKELINRLKELREKANKKKTEKNNMFEKLKKIREELDDIDFENRLSSKKYKKQLADIIGNKSDIQKEEIINHKYQDGLQAMKKNFIKSKIIMETSKLNKSSICFKDIKDNSIINNINNQILSSRNNKNNELKNKFKDNYNNINKLFSNINKKSTKNIYKLNLKKGINNQSLTTFQMEILKSKKKRELEDFQNSQIHKENFLKLTIKYLQFKISKLNKELESGKKEEKEIINKLMLFYKEILYKAKKVKKDGLVWIIKAIWYLGENVPMSFLPPFLDFDSIEYLFKLAHKQLEIEYFTKKVHEMKLSLKKDISDKYKNDFIRLKIKYKSKKENNNSLLLDKSKFYINMKKANNESISEEKKNVYLDLVKEFEEKNRQFELMNLPEINRINSVKEHLQKIKDDIIKLKQNEIKRISKCFIENNYEEIYHTNIETVLSALIGTDTKDTEMNKYHILKKNHMLKLKKIRFFDHEHVRKILSIKE